MKTCGIGDLVNSDFDVRFLNTLKQFWRITKTFQCINSPKKQDLLLYVNGFTITYTDQNNNVYIANSGDIVYVPTGSEYTVQISDAQDENSYTIGVNFLLFDESGEQITISDNIEVFHIVPNKSISMLFQQIITYDTHYTFQPIAMKKIVLLEIICTLASNTIRKNFPKIIIDSLSYLSEHIEENPSIRQLASHANVSEVYFRKQFKRNLGITPVEYRNLLRLDKARSFLEYGEISVQEISDILGYSTVSHFIKEFRNHYGTSPLQYRNRFRDK